MSYSISLKVRSRELDVSHSLTKKDGITAVFSFGTSLLPNAVKHVGKIKLSGLVDLDKAGSTELVVDNTNQVLIISLGKKNGFDLAGYFKVLNSLINQLKSTIISETINIILEDELAGRLNLSVVELYEQSMFQCLNYCYEFVELKTALNQKSSKNNRSEKTFKLLNFVTPTANNDILNNVSCLIDGLCLVRHLENNPANIVTPSYLAKTAKSFAKYSDKVKATILDEVAAKKLGMNAFLSVARGSDEPAKFIQLEYKGAAKSNKKPIVLVGKGITFDSGGISLKPSANMDGMKFDMSGAATVLGVFASSVKLKLPINLVVLVPTCENLISGKATKPGDVITTMKGLTVEIQNTDAEGRLILCDALHYAKQFNPELVIDVATLTGACIIALGGVNAGLYSNDDKLATDLQNSGNKTGDTVWRMPLHKDYHDMLKGETADISNIGSWKAEAGSVTAACFLEKFVDYRWAHLDIAGVYSGKSIFSPAEYKLANGRPFYLLMEYIRNFIS